MNSGRWEDSSIAAVRFSNQMLMFDCCFGLFFGCFSADFGRFCRAAGGRAPPAGGALPGDVGSAWDWKMERQPVHFHNKTDNSILKNDDFVLRNDEFTMKKAKAGTVNKSNVRKFMMKMSVNVNVREIQRYSDTGEGKVTELFMKTRARYLIRRLP